MEQHWCTLLVIPAACKQPFPAPIATPVSMGIAKPMPLLAPLPVGSAIAVFMPAGEAAAAAAARVSKHKMQCGPPFACDRVSKATPGSGPSLRPLRPFPRSFPHLAVSIKKSGAPQGGRGWSRPAQCRGSSGALGGASTALKCPASIRRPSDGSREHGLRSCRRPPPPAATGGGGRLLPRILRPPILPVGRIKYGSEPVTVNEVVKRAPSSNASPLTDQPAAAVQQRAACTTGRGKKLNLGGDRGCAACM